MEWLNQFVRTEYIILGFDKEITVLQMALALVALLLGFALGKFVSYLIGHRLKKLSEKTQSTADDFLTAEVNKPVSLVFQITGIYLALKIIGIPTVPYNFEFIVDTAFHIFLALDATWFLTKLVDGLQLHLESRAMDKEEAVDNQVVKLITKSIKTFIWILAGVLILQNLGYSISGLLAGLGLGGLAVAMAAKDTLSNLFGSLTVFLDRPFKVGDIVTIGGHTGTVEQIGFRSMRIRTFDDTLITMPNQKLTTAEVENISSRRSIRVKTQLGLVYSTSVKQMGSIIDGISEILTNHEKVLEGFHCRFSEFGDSSLNITLIYKVDTGSYAEYLTAQQEVNMKIMECVEENGSDFAFPTRTVHLEEEKWMKGLVEKA